MKNVTILACFIVILSSCKSDDDANLNETTSLDARFTMTGYFAFTPEAVDLIPGDITWEFISNTQELVVINNREDDYPWIQPTSGIYDFNISQDTIEIETVGIFTFDININTLSLTFLDDPQIADDELRIEFESY